MARKTKEEALETRENILKATLDVFSEKGYSKSTFVDIAERVGLTKGAVYWHFKCKGELLVELIQRMHEKEERLLKEKLKKEGIHFHNLKEYYLARARLVLENEEFRKFAFFISLQMEWTVEHLTYASQKFKEPKTRFFQETYRVLKEAQEGHLLKKDVDVQQVEDCLVALFKGLIKTELSGFSSTNLIENLGFCFDAIVDKIKV